MNTAKTATPSSLSQNQIAILTHAIDHTQGRVEWFPDTIRGGARQKVTESLFRRGLVIGRSGDWHVTAGAYDVLGRTPPDPRACETEAPIGKRARKSAAKAAAAPTDAATGDLAKAAPRTRENSKQAQVIAMLRRPEGATIAQICEVTNWQAHTVRGTFAGAFKKTLGLTITSDKVEGGERVYRTS